MKRVLSLILAASMLLSMLPVEALAEMLPEEPTQWTQEPLVQPEFEAAEESIPETYAEETVVVEADPVMSSARASEFESILTGTVLDENGAGLADVTVTVYDVAEKTYLHTDIRTNSGGVWTVSDAWIGDSYVINFYKAGFTFPVNDLPCTSVAGGVTLKTVTAQSMNLNTVCKEADYTYTTDTAAETATITAYTGTDAHIQLPETLGGYPVAAIANDAFRGNTTLETVVFSGSVSSIGAYAFYECTSLKQVCLPNTLVTLSDGAFRNCSALTEVVLPDTVKTISYRAFQNCASLQQIRIPLNWKSSGGQVFQGCTALTEITLPEGMVKLPGSAFDQADCLQTVHLPSTLETIGSYAFNACTAMASVEFPAKLKTLEDGAFQHCSALETVSLPDTVQTIGYRAFRGCTALSRFDYPLDWNSTGGSVFLDCSSLNVITVPEGVTSIPWNAFENANYLQSVTLPSTLTSLGGWSFSYCSALTEITIPSGVETIKSGAFNGCSALVTVNLPDGLTEIHEYAFQYCTSLKTVALPDSVTYLGCRAFRGCTGLSSINYPLSLIETDDQIFFGCSALTAITVPEGVTFIPQSAFESADYLQSVTLPSTLTSLGSWCFTGCTSLKEITIPAGVTAISNSVFSGCSALRTVNLPETLTEIREYAFQNCVSLETIAIPDTVTYMGYRAFRGCSKLSSINYPLSLTETAHQIFLDCAALTKITVPEGVAFIPQSAFESANYLKQITLPTTLTSVDAWSFYDCPALTRVVLPEAVTAIGDGAFQSCTALLQIWLGENVTEIGSDVFADSPSVTIHGVSGSSAEAYAAEYGIPFSTEAVGFNLISVTGKVTDGTGAGLADVSVSVYDVTDGKYIYSDLKTDANGEWSIPDAILNHRLMVQYHKTCYTFSSNDILCDALSGGVTLDPVTAMPLPVDNLVCNAEDYTYTVDTAMETATVTGYTGTDTAIQIPETLGGYPVTVIASGAFQKQNTLETVVFPGALEVIESYAFENCSALKQMYFPYTLTEVQDGAFQYCTSLETVTLPNSVHTIGYRAFRGCTALSRFDYPLSWTYAESNIFRDCSALTEITVPEGITTLPRCAFDTANYLQSVTLPSTLTTVSNSAFSACSALTQITIPAGVTEIDNYAFNSCSALETVELPEGLTRIGECAFQYCTALESITLPDSVTSIGYRAFRGSSNLSSINYPLNLTETASNIFQNCTSFTEITIPEGVTFIPQNAFENAESLKSVILPSTVTMLDSWSFAYCTALKEITVPSGVTEIYDNTFHGCSALRSVTLPETVTAIGEAAFRDCVSLESITLPDSVEYIAYRAFRGCTKLSNVNYPLSLANTGSQIFMDCASLTQITVPEGVTFIPQSAFENANYLKTVKLPSTVTSIGSWSFTNCAALTHLILPDAVTQIGDSAFRSCGALLQIWLGELVTQIGSDVFRDSAAVTIHGVSGSYAETYATENSIPFSTEEVGFNLVSVSGKVVDEAGNGLGGVSVSVFDVTDGAYLHMDLLTAEDGSWQIDDAIRSHEVLIQFYKLGYTFPVNKLTYQVVTGGVTAETVTAVSLHVEGLVCNAADFTYTVDTSLETAAVTGYTGTDTAIQIPEALGGYPVTTIASNAFQKNGTLETVVFPSGLETILSYAFENCTALKNLYLPEGLVSIHDSAFQYCTALETVTLPDSVRNIYYRAFRGCSKLSTINYPLNWQEAGGQIFYGCSVLTEITIPEGVTMIPASAFDDAKFLQTVHFPSTLKSIGSYAFSSCAALTAAHLPEGLVEIWDGAFQYCTAMETVTVPDSVETLGYRAFRHCILLTDFHYPLSLRNAGSQIFYGCTGLTHMVVPEGVTSIPGSTFSEAINLESIQLPSTLTEIGGYAFYSCTAMKEVTLPEGLLSIGDGVFSGCRHLQRIDIPDSVERIGYRAFLNCVKLTHFDYPRNLNSSGGQLFNGCTRLVSITVPEGVTALPDGVFSDSAYLKAVSLPDSLTTIGGSAFRNCDKLRVLNIPLGVTEIGDYAFSDCESLRSVMIGSGECRIGYRATYRSPNVVLYCAYHSPATIYAIENLIPFMQTGSAVETADNVLNYGSSGYYTDMKSVTANGYLYMTVNYSIKESLASSVEDRLLHLVLPPNGYLNEETLKLDGVLCTDYRFDGERTLQVPVTADSGTLKFAMEITQQGQLYSYAALERHYNGVTKRDIVGILNDQTNMLTMNVPDVTAKATFTVNGLAPASAKIDVYLDGVLQNSFTASKAGNWSGSITIPQPKDYYPYTVYASCTVDGETMNQSAKVTYRENEATMTGFLMFYDEHSQIKTCDLMNTGNVKPKVYFLPNTQFNFEVTFDHPEQIDKLYITSTRNNVTKYLEAFYDEATGKFVTDGFFDENDRSYVPGTLSIQYTKKVDSAYIADTFDWTLFDDQVANMTSDTVTIKTNTENDLEATIDLGTVYDGLKDVAVDTSISVYDAATDGDLGEWLGVFKELDTIASYVVPGYNDEKYLVSLDYSDPYTTVMLIRDVSGSKFIKMTLDTALDNADNLDDVWTLTQVSSYLSTTNTVADMLLSQYQITQDMDDLREEVWATPYATPEARTEALKKVDALENDQRWFALITAVIPLVVASGGVMAGPTLVMTAMLGVFTAVAPFFWEMRTAQIKGQKFRIDFVIDPSGYVYDIETGERIEGVKTTAYHIPYDDTDTFWDNVPGDDVYGTKWNAEEYDQANPLYTNADGKYAWDVPEGWWRVKYEKDGYLTTWSEWLPVPPPQTEVNIGMTPGHEHSWVDATCTAPKTCSTCGETEGEELGHAWTDATCTAPKTCSACGETVGEALDHQWDSGKVTLQPTQDKTGIKTYTCTRCGETKEETLDKLPEDPVCKHQNTEKIPAVDATCTMEGKTEGKKCSDCGEILTAQQAVPKIDHTYGEWTVTVAPTGAANGKEIRTCQHCGAEQERSIEKLVNPFEDVVEGKFYFEPVLWAYYGGITTGKDATHFNPSGFCTRSQVVTFLWRAAGQPEPASSENPFPDVPEGKFYTKAVLWAVEQGITAGFKDGTFGPNDACTRGQIVTFLWRYFGEPEPSSMNNPFPDVAESKFYYKAVLWAVENEITGGFKDGTFGPNKTCTRDQIVTFLYRAMVE